MLYWENEDPARGVVHHLMVLSYHLQHPSLYSPEGLEYGLQLLEDFLEGGVSPQQARRRNRRAVASDQRQWTIRSRPGRPGVYQSPVHWSMRALDVVEAGAEQYVPSVQQWARAILSDLRAAGQQAPKGLGVL